MGLDSAMPQLYKLFSLVATIGATPAGVEKDWKSQLVGMTGLYEKEQSAEFTYRASSL